MMSVAKITIDDACVDQIGGSTVPSKPFISRVASLLHHSEHSPGFVVLEGLPQYFSSQGLSVFEKLISICHQVLFF
jgi:hypothetical protein